jgi:hypothetical protein
MFYGLRETLCIFSNLLVFFFSLSGHIMYIFQHDQFLILG